MQIDFHHGVTYILARLAGFSQEEANIVAFCSQYVDNATSNVPIRFKNGPIYKPICSAHEMLDYRNFDELASHLVWTTFHFLPGNCMLPRGKGEEYDFTLRLICRPNSFVSQDMVKECIKQSKEVNGLQRLGITLHVYADTWAHQGFSGIKSEVNRVQFIDDNDESQDLINKLANFFTDTFDRKCSCFIEGVLPLGHGAVLSYPDRPYLKWMYKDYKGNLVQRNNLDDFLDAAKNMFIVMKRFRQNDPDAIVEGLSQENLEQIKTLFEEINDVDGKVRHRKWLEKICEGCFSFGPEQVEYNPEGVTDWERENLGDIRYYAGELDYSFDFMNCNWKKFHDALRDHHYFLLRRLFPGYSLCIA